MAGAEEELAEVLRSLEELRLDRAGRLDNASLALKIVALCEQVDALSVIVARLQVAVDSLRRQADLRSPDRGE